MAIIFTLTGGVLGFVAAIATLVAGHGVLAALALWSGAGVAFMALAMTLALLPRREPAPVRREA
jgi:hypothetical protein